MASPMVEGRVDPHKKAHFTLHISDAIADGEVGDYTSLKYNHKPAQTTSKRTTTLTSTAANKYRLTLEDEKAGDNKDVFIFTGQRTVPKKSYILLFDSASQKATLEPLSSTYTFNIASKNGADISTTHSKIFPRKQKDDAAEDAAGDDLFGEGTADTGDGEPDPNNPYDFRHFLNADKNKRGDESEYAPASSPGYRTDTGSAMDTPPVTARRSAATAKPKATPQAAAKAKKRKEPELVPKKAPAKKQAPPPTVRLERRVTETKAKTTRKAAPPPPSSKIKSAEIVHSSDESDADAEGEPDTMSSPPARRSPSPRPPRHDTPESDEDDDAMEDVQFASGLEIEGESQPRNGALASLGLGQNIGLGFLNSPSNGPRSLASAASSVQGSPDPHAFTPQKARRGHQDDAVIDFGDFGVGNDDDAEGEDDGDVESMQLGSPVQGGVSLDADGDVDADGEAEEEEEDPLLKEMMAGLEGGDSSEESEEE